jgi:hypothetical protein
MIFKAKPRIFRSSVLVSAVAHCGLYRRTFVSACRYAPRLIPGMAYDTRFGPSAQTPEQRALVLAQMHDAIPSLKTNATAVAQQLYARYVAGELSWLDVHEALKTST